MLDELRGYAGPSRPPRTPVGPGAVDLLLPIHIKKDDLELRLFSTVMTLGTPQDVTLQELRIETFFPADEASERMWRKMAEAQPTGSKAIGGALVFQPRVPNPEPQSGVLPE